MLEWGQGGSGAESFSHLQQFAMFEGRKGMCNHAATICAPGCTNLYHTTGGPGILSLGPQHDVVHLQYLQNLR